MRMLSQSLDAAKRMKRFLVIVVTLYVVSYLIGWYMVNNQIPPAVQMKQGIHEAVLSQEPFLFVLDFLKRGKLLEAIVATFTVNLSVGAFLTTTLPGIIPVLGALAIAVVTLIRGFVIGVTYPEVLATSPAAFVLGIGTLILELGAYVFSGAAGINIAIAPLFPRRYGVQSRIEAFKRAWIDAGRIFIIVAILLVFGAIWEMTGLFLIAH